MNYCFQLVTRLLLRIAFLRLCLVYWRQSLKKGFPGREAGNQEWDKKKYFFLKILNNRETILF
jgi:hypothetical protein